MVNVLISRIVFDMFSGFAVLVFLGLRLYHQWNLRRALEKSDIWANTSIALSTTIFITWLAFSTKTRVELLDWEKDPIGLPPPIRSKGHKLHFIGGFAYVTALWLIKSAFLATYYRLIPSLHTKVRIALYCTSVFTAMTFASNILLHGLYCLPIQTNWTSGPHNCTTFRSVPSLTANTYTNVATDLLIMALPLFIIKSMKLKRREGFALVFVFLVGIASTIASILRWAFIFFAYRQVQDNAGAVYKIEIIKVWTTAEVSTASIAFCLPVLRNLVRKKWFKKKNQYWAGSTVRNYMEERRKRAAERKGDSGVEASATELRDVERGGIWSEEVEMVEPGTTQDERRQVMHLSEHGLENTHRSLEDWRREFGTRKAATF